MSTFDQTSPSQSHGALSDIDVIRNNTIALRDHESSAEASPPSNPVSGGDWHTSDTEKRYVRTNAGGWLYLWSVSDPPAKSSDLTTHTGSNITSSVTVHGIRQGAGNGLDADLLDGNHSSAFLGASHGTATSGIHGVGAGVIVGTTLTQTLTNKTITGANIVGGNVANNITVQAGKTIDGRDLSSDGAKLDTYPGGGVASVADGVITPVKLSAQTAGDYCLSSNDTERTTTSTGYVKLKETKIAKSGTYRIKFEIKISGTTSPNAYGQIYRNGVAVGIERNTASTTYIPYSEDISGWSAGDLIQIYAKNTSAFTTFIRNFRIHGETPGDFGIHLTY